MKREEIEDATKRNQVMQLASTAISEGLTSISGLLTTHKTIIDNVVGSTVTNETYTSIG